MRKHRCLLRKDYEFRKSNQLLQERNITFKSVCRKSTAKLWKSYDRFQINLNVVISETEREGEREREREREREKEIFSDTLISSAEGAEKLCC